MDQGYRIAGFVRSGEPVVVCGDRVSQGNLNPGARNGHLPLSQQDSQCARRNLTPEEQRYLLGRRYTAEKNVKGGTGANQYTAKEQKRENLASASGDDKPPRNTAEKIGRDAGVSDWTVVQSEKFANAVDDLDKRGIVPKSDVLSGKVKAPATRIVAASRKCHRGTRDIYWWEGCEPPGVWFRQKAAGGPRATTPPTPLSSSALHRRPSEAPPPRHWQGRAFNTVPSRKARAETRFWQAACESRTTPDIRLDSIAIEPGIEDHANTTSLPSPVGTRLGTRRQGSASVDD